MKAQFTPEIEQQLKNFYESYKIPVLVTGSGLMLLTAFLITRSFFKKDKKAKKDTISSMLKFGSKTFLTLLTSSRGIAMIKKAEFLKSVVNIQE